MKSKKIFPKSIFQHTLRKKGLIDDTMLAILAVAAILVLVVFTYGLYGYFKEKMSVQNCKSSIEAHSAISKWTAREMFTDIKCPTNEITIKNNEKAKEIIAQDMQRCWYIWGQGKGQYFEGDGNFCHICSIYQFSDKGQEIEGFMTYLGTQRMKTKYPGDTQGITYADYFMGVSTPQSADMVDRQIDNLAQTDYINTSQRYATIFVYASGKKAVQKAMESGNRAMLGEIGLGGVLIGGTATAATATIVTVFAVSNPVGWIAGGLAIAGAGAAAIWQSTVVKEPESVQFLIFRPYDANEFNNIGCDNLFVNQMSNTAKP